MNKFRIGLLCGAITGMVTGATVFAQFATPPGGPVQSPEAMSNAERRAALERCDTLPIGAAKDRCMNELQVNRNAAQAIAPGRDATASRVGDGRTGAPGIGTGSSAMRPDPSAERGRLDSGGQGARSNGP